MSPSFHTHTPVRNEQGQDICTSCYQMIIRPIRDSDDPRLQGSGLMRSNHHDAYDEAYPPLPEMLIALYHNGSAIGLANAPAAPYIEITAEEMGRRSMVGGPDDIWEYLYEGWLEKCPKNYRHRIT